MLNLLYQETVGHVLVFSDEEDFHVDKLLNRRNDRYLATSTKDADPSISYIGASKLSAMKMMLDQTGQSSL